MGITLYWTFFAKEELRKIYDYHREVVSKKIAKNPVSGIVQKTVILQEHPYAGHVEEYLHDKKIKFRFLVYTGI